MVQALLYRSGNDGKGGNDRRPFQPPGRGGGGPGLARAEEVETVETVMAVIGETTGDLLVEVVLQMEVMVMMTLMTMKMNDSSEG